MLQNALNHHQLGLIDVWDCPIMWLDKEEYTKLLKYYNYIRFDHSTTLRCWINSNAAHSHQFSLAVITTPPTFSVDKESKAEWLARPFHL
jgi:hypothetical protein